MDKKVIFFDIDGTLILPNTHEILPSTFKILEELSQRDDVDLYISTGRGILTIYDIDPIKKYFTGFNAANGNHVVYQGEDLFVNCFDEEELRKLFDTLDSMKVSYGLFEPHKNYRKYYQKDIKDYFDRVVNCEYELLDNDKPSPVKDIVEFWIFATKDVMDIVKEKHPEVTYYYWGNFGCDVVPYMTSKVAGIKKIIELKGYKWENTYCFGDADNDIPMFDAIENSICMGQATEEVKSHAKYITDDVDKDGIYNGVKKYILND